MRKKFERAVNAAGQEFHPGKLDVSFRSALGITSAIDTIFARPEAFRGLSADVDQKGTDHVAIRNAAPALVEVWEATKIASSEDEELAWDAPLNAQSETSAPALLATRIAKATRCWLEGGITVGETATEKPRRPNAGDIIVLVRRRGPLFEAILRALKREGIEVAGADRLRLAEHIAVMDLAALSDALLLEADDLALACALKSPLLGLTEKELLLLAHKREGTLAGALAEAAHADERMRKIFERIELWRDEALSLRPFDFFSRILGRDKGRERILARFGNEAADALDELLAHALTYEKTETPSLQGFLAFLRHGESQVKRDLEVESKAVRVMTVHGVKGLEAPIIVLADTTATPESRYQPWLIPVGSGADNLIWALSNTEDPPAVARARETVMQLEEEEYRRLLYVALTRARDVLVICGALNKRQEESKLPAECWYKLVRDALEPDLKEQKDLSYGFDGKIWRWRYGKTAKFALDTQASLEKIAEPFWLRKQIDQPIYAGQVVNPSLLQTEDTLSTGGISTPRDKARRRGELIHCLLQELPKLTEDQRIDRASDYLAVVAADFTTQDRETIINESLAVLNHPEIQNLFGVSSRAEVPILGKLGEGNSAVEIFGRVDRFVVLPDAILIADYKTDSAPPSRPEDAPEHYIVQLARYRAVLRRVFPRKAMRAFLVWTAKPEIQEIPAKLMDEVLLSGNVAARAS
jgi:ATP-dependent helicase/nuclease subunit A